VVRIRPVRPTDREAVKEFLQHLSRESIELRFFSSVSSEVVLAEVLAEPPSPGRLSLLMETVDPTPGAVVGHAEYARSPAEPTRAEMAFLVADDRQGLGAGTLLLWELAREARGAGIRTLEAIVLTENQAMLEVFTGAGFPHTITSEGPESRMALDIARDPQTTLCPVGLPRRGATAAT
jgi:GNAT superfamily N-acetyltransferase